jgi:plasmid stability protein
MKAITLRNIPPEVARKIRQRAARRRTSVNKAVLSLLEERLGTAEHKVEFYHDLDALAGSWSREEAEAFDRILESQRGIDPEIWSK